MSEARRCINCGRPLRKGYIWFCSRACRTIYEATVPKEDRFKMMKPIPQKTDMEIIIEGMEREHLSYGEYVAKYGL